MAKRFFGFLKSHSQNTGTQVAFLDPEKVASCLQQVSSNSKLLQDLYSAFVSMLRTGKTKLNITEDMIESLQNETSKFDKLIDKFATRIKHDEDDIRARKYRVLQMKKENEQLKRTIEKFRNEKEWHTLEEEEHDEQRKENMKKLNEIRKEKNELEKKLQQINDKVEELVEKLHHVGERVDNIQVLRENHLQDHKEEMQVIVKFWSETKAKRTNILKIKPGEDYRDLIKGMAKDQTDIISLEEDNECLRIKQQLLDAQIHDELEDQEEIFRSNQELLSRMVHNEEIVFFMKATREGMSEPVIAAKWHDHVQQRPRDWYKSLPASEDAPVLPDRENEMKIVPLNN